LQQECVPSLQACVDTLLFELSSLHSDMSLNLKGLLLSIGLSFLCVFEGIGFGEDSFSLLLYSLLSLSLVGSA
jgi:hypothetical protein